MELTKEEAVRLFHEQWSDMQKELGDCPDPELRIEYKERWCEKHFPGESILNNCFLCEYVDQVDIITGFGCRSCPIAWPLDRLGMPHCGSYLFSSISEILALPVREEV